MSEWNEQHTDLWPKGTLDPRSPFFERDLRQLRWAKTCQSCSIVLVMVRVMLADTLEHLARRMRPKGNVNSIGMS